MAMSAAERQRKHRQLKGRGKSVLPIEIDGELADKLADAGWLEGWSSEDPKAIAQALSEALSRLEKWPVTRDARKKS